MLISISGQTERSFKENFRSMLAFLRATGESLTSISYTNLVHRDLYLYRQAFAATDREHLVQLLETFQNEAPPIPISNPHLKIGIVFPGTGSAFAGAGLELFETCEVFRRSLYEVAGYSRETGGPDPIACLYGASADRLHKTPDQSICVLALGYAYFRLLEALGLKPCQLYGHSLGEIVALACSGVLSLRDAVSLVNRRAVLVESCAPGSMVVALADENAYTAPSHIYKCVVNSRNNVVYGGEPEAMDEFIKVLKARNIRTAKLSNCHAFHSPMLASAAHEIKSFAKAFSFHPPRIAFQTSLQLSKSLEPGPEWFKVHLQDTYDFVPVADALQSHDLDLVFEAGGGQGLCSILQNSHQVESRTFFVPLCSKTLGARLSLESALAELMNRGGAPECKALFQVAEGSKKPLRRVALPSYALDEKYSYRLPLDHEYALAQSPSSTSAVQPLTAPQNDSRLLGTPSFFDRVSQEQPADDEGPPSTLWYKTLDLEGKDGFLRDHVVDAEPILPGMFSIELALQIATALNIPRPVTQNLYLTRRVPLKAPKLQLHVKVQASLPSGFSLVFYYTEPMSSTPLSYARCELTSASEGSTFNRRKIDPLDILRLIKDSSPLNKEEIYTLTRKRGFSYGPAFSGAMTAYPGEKAILLKVNLPKRESFILDPCLLDSAAHARMNDIEGLFVPHHIQQSIFFEPLPCEFYCLIIPTRKTDGLYVADQVFLHANGLEIGRLVGYERCKIPEPAFGDNLKGLLHTWGLAYETYDLYQEKPTETMPRAMTDQPAEGGMAIIVLGSMPADDQSESALLMHLSRLLQAPVIAARSIQKATDLLSYRQSIIYAIRTSGNGLYETAQRQLTDLVSLLKILNEGQVLLSHVIMDEQDSIFRSLGAAACMVGALRSYYSENSTFMANLIHIGGLGHNDAKTIERSLAALMKLSAQRLELYHRDHGCFETPRIRPIGIKADSISIESTKPGSMEGLQDIVVPRATTLKDEEIEIVTLYTALNFKDVLYIMGRIERPDATRPICLEAVGRVIRTGPGLSTDLVGQMVTFFPRQQTHRSYYVMPLHEVYLSTRNDIDARTYASVPISLTTAYHGLFHLAKLQQGEKILIHSAAGGLGQLVFLLAREMKCEIYVTAHPDKHQRLRQLGAKGVYSSRSADFAKELRKECPEGVAVVFNSLKDHISESLSTLAPKGRFIEVGKIGVWTADQVHMQRPDISFHPFILNENVAESNINLFKEAMAQYGHVIAQSQSDGTLNVTVMPSTEAKRAYRLLASGKSIGKILLDFGKHDQRGFPQQCMLAIKPNATYLITGGVGQIGKSFLHFLLKKGARHIVLLSRTPLNQDIMNILKEGSIHGAQVTYEQCDVSNPKDLEALANKLTSHYLPLAGIIHASGALADSLLENISPASIEKVFKPKIAGLENLVRCFDPKQLDFFLLFSSVASVLGSATQGVYAAANCFLDMAALSLPNTFSVNWGPWSGGGMAETISASAKKRKERIGVQYMDATEAMKYFEESLGQPLNNVILCPLAWEKFLDTFRTPPHIFTGLKK
jgi:myxalamid-type polyketide synthase MxaB